MAQSPLRWNGVMAQLMLVIVIASDIWLIKAVLHQRSIIDRVIDGDPGVTVVDAGDADHSADAASNWSLLAFVLAAVAFVVWFWLARRTAGGYAPQRQRRSQAWALWGWICPVVNLWFPFQIAADALDSVPNRRPFQPALLRFWWAAYLIAALLNRAGAVQHPQTIADYRAQTTLEILAAVVEVVAAVLAILVVQMISARLDRHRETVLRSLLG